MYPKVKDIDRKYLEGCVDEGWFDLILELRDKIVAIDPNCESHQIKEKFGGLRFYIGGSTKEVFDLISKAELKSYSICEKCGKPGKCRDNTGWYKTLCENHHKARIDENKKRQETFRKKYVKHNTKSKEG